MIAFTHNQFNTPHARGAYLTMCNGAIHVGPCPTRLSTPVRPTPFTYDGP